MKFIVDRFEDNIAMIEIEDGSIVEVEKKLLPFDTKEGDILEIVILKEKTFERKTKLENKFERLLKKDIDK